MRRVLVGWLILSVAFTPGCGTLFFRFLPQKISVTTVPPGAKLSIDGAPPKDVTPVVLRFKPTEDHTIEAIYQGSSGEMRGRVELVRGVRVMPIVMNLIFNLGIGLLLDWLTGALYYFPERELTVPLEPVDGAAPAFSQPAAAEPAAAEPAAAEPAEPAATAEVRRCDLCGEPRGDGPLCKFCGME